ncbi:hypothetical protein PR048_021113 [Dryococelus australis]|uniref:Uncharacterized protein n=1 Tax=Dryococelus australis TaxID=614101 RepID=A0ABQ9GXF9_9NEOP|nr:hypothetical protein PR048_021113 [Dryococelus australis]
MNPSKKDLHIHICSGKKPTFVTLFLMLQEGYCAFLLPLFQVNISSQWKILNITFWPGFWFGESNILHQLKGKIDIVNFLIKVLRREMEAAQRHKEPLQKTHQQSEVHSVVKLRVQEKIDNEKRTGSGGGKEAKINDVNEVYNITGKNLPVIEVL